MRPSFLPAGAAAPALALCAAWALTAIGGPWADTSINDLFVYRTYADLFLGGAVPYHDVPFEYPPLALVPIVLGGLLGTGEAVYAWTFGLLMLGAALAVQALAAALAPLTGGPTASREAVGGPVPLSFARRVAWALAAMPLVLGAMLRTHLDLVPVALLLGALVLLVRERPVAGLALLGAATMTKLFPAVVLPVALAWLLARGERRAALRGAAAFAAVCLVIGLPVAGGLADTARFHLDRPVQIESTPASVVLVAGGGQVTGDPLRPDRFKSNGIDGGGAGALAAASALLMLLALAALVARTAAAPRPGADRLVLGAFGAVLAFVALGKVLSPQYLIWLVPLAAVAWARGARAAPGLVALAGLLTFAEFPARYWDVVAREPAAIALVAARNLVLLAALAVLIASPRAPAAAAARSLRPASAASR